MIQKLERKNYFKVLEIIHPGYIGVEPQSVINGSNPGFICSDSQESPRTAMVFHQGEGGFFFMGDPQNEDFIPFVRDYIFEVLKPELASRGIDSFEFSGDSSQWTQVFRDLFSDCGLGESKQIIYSLESESQVPEPNIDEAYDIRAIDEELLGNLTLENRPFLIDTIKEWWSDEKNFLENGFGYVAMAGKEIAGRCLTDGRLGGLTAIGIATKEEHKGKGIATALASTLILEILRLGHMPYWECMDENILSKKTAEKCGLAYDFSYRLFYFDL